MQVTFDIPDELAPQLGADRAAIDRRAREAFVAAEYRAGRLNKTELRRLLGIEALNEVDGFLKAHGVYEEYTLAELDREVAAMQRLGF